MLDVYCFSYTCIVCQEEHRQTGEEPAIVLAAFIQRSTVLRWANDQAATEELLPDTWPALVDGGRRIGTHISTCGHVMHFKCWQQHFDSLLGRERRRSYRSASYPTLPVDCQSSRCGPLKSATYRIVWMMLN